MNSLLRSVLVASLLGLIAGFVLTPSDEQEAFPPTDRYQVLFRQLPTPEWIESISNQAEVVNFARFDSFDSPFFSRVYELHLKKGADASFLDKLNFVEKVFKPQAVELLSVYPANKGELNLNDEYSSYQWALKNIYRAGDENFGDDPENVQGHLTKADITDKVVKFRTSLPVDGSQKTFDISYGPESKRVSQLSVDKPVVVAVLDSGIDWDHEDLKENIFRNESQCENGRIPRLKPEQKEYEGDCVGWNFTVPPGHPARNRPFDHLGHGTHVAGIIAAIRDNKVGVAGVSNHIKILPVKIVGKGENEENIDGDQIEQAQAFTDQVAKAIRYSVYRGAKVINLSLGWPKVANVELLTNAIDEALKKNVTIVAASGNNGHSTRIFPCAIDGVICAGAMNNDGTLTSFSNYGGHVDVVAPGRSILSTFPGSSNNMQTPSFFSTNGYEVKSGSSQAAPYTSALVAMLKLKYSRISNREVLARILSTVRPVLEEDSLGKLFPARILGGAIQFDEALSAKPQPYIRPLLKKVDLVKYNPLNKRATLELQVANDWALARDVRIKISSPHQGVVLGKTQFYLGDMSQGAIKVIKVPLRLKSDDIDSEWSFTLEASSKGGVTHRSWQQTYLVRDLESDNRLGKWTLSEKFNAKTFSPVVNVRMESPQPTFYSYDLPKNEGEEILFQIHKVIGTSVASSSKVKIPNFHLIPKKLSVPSFQVFMMNLDEDPALEFMIAGVFSKDEQNYFQQTFLDSDLSNLYGPNSHWVMKLAHVGPDLISQKFISYNMPDLGVVKVLVFEGIGILDELDASELDPFEFVDPNSIEPRIYALLPVWQDGSVQLRPKVIDSEKFLQQLRRDKMINLRDVDRLELAAILEQGSNDYRQGRVKLLYSVGSESQGRHAIVEIDESTLKSGAFNVEMLKAPGRYLTYNSTSPIIDLSESSIDFNKGTSFYDDFERVKFRGLFVREDQRESPIQQEVVFVPQEETNYLVKFHGSYFDGEDYLSFVETGSDTMAVLKNANGSQKVFRRKVVRSTLLPGYYFSELFYPTVIKSDKSWVPGLYVDATHIAASHVMVWQASWSGAKVSAKFNLSIPESCRTLDRMKVDESGKQAIAMLCEEKGETFVRLVPLEE